MDAAPVEVVTLAQEAVSLVRQGGLTDISATGLEVAEALIGWGGATVNERHLRAMARHGQQYPVGSINAALFGDETGARWASGQLSRIAAVAEAERQARSLPKMSRALRTADERFRDRAEQVLTHALRAALRLANTKVDVRAAKTPNGRLGAVRDDWRQRRITPAFLAAIATTMDELVAGRFDDAGDQIALLYRRRQDAHRKALLAAYPDDLDRDELDAQMAPQEDQRATVIAAFVGAALFAEASRRLQAGPGVSLLDQRGEAPIDVNTPSSVVGDLVRVANGAPVDANGEVAPPGTSLDGRVPTWDYTDDLTDQIIQQVQPDVTVTYTWTVGEPAHPFEPHQDLDGQTATNETYWTVFAKDPGDWPEGEAWMPGDHDGCQCDLAAEYGEPGEE